MQAELGANHNTRYIVMTPNTSLQRHIRCDMLAQLANGSRLEQLRKGLPLKCPGVCCQHWELHGLQLAHAPLSAPDLASAACACLIVWLCWWWEACCCHQECC